MFHLEMMLWVKNCRCYERASCLRDVCDSSIDKPNPTPNPKKEDLAATFFAATFELFERSSHVICSLSTPSRRRKFRLMST